MSRTDKERATVRVEDVRTLLERKVAEWRNASRIGVDPLYWTAVQDCADQVESLLTAAARQPESDDCDESDRVPGGEFVPKRTPRSPQDAPGASGRDE